MLELEETHARFQCPLVRLFILILGSPELHVGTIAIPNTRSRPRPSRTTQVAFTQATSFARTLCVAHTFFFGGSL